MLNVMSKGYSANDKYMCYYCRLSSNNVVMLSFF